ncbi:MAG: hypothetical protein N2109_01695 [Fimbriimonadales bacterium]|nr:hypothetical protein [Fimbriimonadales bacterium]
MIDLLFGLLLLSLAIGFLALGREQPQAPRLQGHLIVALDSTEESPTLGRDFFVLQSRLLPERSARAWISSRVESALRALEGASSGPEGSARLVCRFDLRSDDGSLVERFECVHPVPPDTLTREGAAESFQRLAEALL